VPDTDAPAMDELRGEGDGTQKTDQGYTHRFLKYLRHQEPGTFGLVNGLITQRKGIWLEWRFWHPTTTSKLRAAKGTQAGGGAVEAEWKRGIKYKQTIRRNRSGYLPASRSRAQCRRPQVDDRGRSRLLQKTPSSL
jgi:hypothetical protein